METQQCMTLKIQISLEYSLWGGVSGGGHQRGAEPMEQGYSLLNIPWSWDIDKIIFFIFPWTFHSLDIWADKEIYSITFLPPVTKTVFEGTSVSPVKAADGLVV